MAKEIGDEEFESDSDHFECQALPEEYDAQNNDGGILFVAISQTFLRR